jgi:hypothetical protein
LKKKINFIERLNVALFVCEKRLKDVDDQLDDPVLNILEIMIL